jgi:CRP-like cAMP-binding protein
MPNDPREKRKHERIESLNLLNYLCMDENHEFVESGMGRTLNVSLSGILLETHVPIESRRAISLAIGLEDDVVNILGRIVYCRKGRDEMYQSGVHFFEREEEAAFANLRKYIQAFRAQAYSEPDAEGGQTDEIGAITAPPIDYMYIVEEETYLDGTSILEEGKYGSWIWVVLEGKVEIVKNTMRGPMRLATLGEGSFVGSIVSLLVLDNTRKASAVARGRVQLGLIDSSRLVQEFGAMPVELRRLILGVDKRLNQVSEQVVALWENSPSDRRFTSCNTPAIHQGEADTNLYQILQGSAAICNRTGSGDLYLALLGQGELFGRLPFLDLGQEPAAAAVMASSDFKVAIADVKALQDAYERTSYSFQNIIQNLARCVKGTTRLLEKRFLASRIAPPAPPAA